MDEGTVQLPLLPAFTSYAQLHKPTIPRVAKYSGLLTIGRFRHCVTLYENSVSATPRSTWAS